MNQLNSLEDALAKAMAVSGPLNERLDVFRAEHAMLSPSISQEYDRLVERLETALSGLETLNVGDLFPEFLLPNDEGGLTCLAEVLNEGPALISFNRGHWCHYCRLELLALNIAYPSIRDLGANVICIVPERQHFAKKLRNGCSLPFPVLADIDGTFGLELGLLISIGEKLRALYLAAGIDISTYQGGGGWFLPIPASYLVDQSGVVRARFVDPDFRRRADPDAMVKQLSLMVA